MEVLHGMQQTANHELISEWQKNICNLKHVLVLEINVLNISFYF